MGDAKTVVCELWGASEVESAIEEFQSVSKNDGSDLDSRWSEILEEPHSRGCINVVFAVTFRQHSGHGDWIEFSFIKLTLLFL